MKRIVLLIALAVLVSSGLPILDASPCAAAEPRSGNVELTLISFGSLQGDVEMCGCHRGPKGGIARRAAWLDSLSAGNHFVQFDLGDFASVKQGTAEFETRFIWGMMERMKVAATAIGPRELSVWPIVQELAGKETIPVLCSNVTVQQAGEDVPAGRRVHVLQSNGIRIGLLSLIGPEEFRTVEAPPGIEFSFSDPFTVARRIVPDLHQKADIVVLLSQMSTAETDSLIRAIPGIDVALYGHDAEYEDAAARVGSTIVNRTGVRGQYAGRLTLTVDPAGKVVGFRSENLPLAKSMAEDLRIAEEVKTAVAKVKEMEDAYLDRREAEFEKKLSEGK
jgi:2',3'-cyclic-nucleotide 2'-phosphodiesterase (5'-nucleotidase family)